MVRVVCVCDALIISNVMYIRRVVVVLARLLQAEGMWKKVFFFFKELIDLENFRAPRSAANTGSFFRMFTEDAPGIKVYGVDIFFFLSKSSHSF